MTLTRPLCILDVESTGLSPTADRIIEFAVAKMLPDGIRREWCQRFNPGMPIPTKATEIHGITDEMVRDCPPFSAMAPQIHRGLDGCDLVGYNLLNFDLQILDAEFERCGIVWDLTGVNVIDAGAIFKKQEPRTLEAAVRFYCNREHAGAHGALADALATWEVLESQRRRYPDLTVMDVTALAEFSKLDKQPRIDLAGKLLRGEDGHAIYNFGKQKGTAVYLDSSLAEWMLAKDFSENTKRAVRKVLEEEVYVS